MTASQKKPHVVTDLAEKSTETPEKTSAWSKTKQFAKKNKLPIAIGGIVGLVGAAAFLGRSKPIEDSADSLEDVVTDEEDSDADSDVA